MPENDVYSIEISFLGLETLVVDINTTNVEDAIQKNFVLKPQSNELDDVELVYEMPVTIKGDTIVYDADSFARGNER